MLIKYFILQCRCESNERRTKKKGRERDHNEGRHPTSNGRSENSNFTYTKRGDFYQIQIILFLTFYYYE